MERTIPDTIQPKGASERVLAALNGSSSGSTAPWENHPGDYLHAEVRGRGTYKQRMTQRDTERLILCVEEGTECGKPMAHHCHRVLACFHAELRNLVAELDPRPGDLLTIIYLGRDDTQGRTARHLFRYSVEKREGSRDGHDF